MNYAYNEAQMLAGIADYRKTLPPRKRHITVIPPKLEFHGVRMPVVRRPRAPYVCPLTTGERELIQNLTAAAAEEFGLTADELRSNRRKANFLPRFVAMYLIRRETPASLLYIGRHFCNHHTTVRYAVQKISTQVEKDAQLRKRIEGIAVTVCGPRSVGVRRV